MIAEATHEDVLRLVSLCGHFHEWSNWPGNSVFDPYSCERSFKALVDRDNCTLLHGGGGLMGLSVVPLFFNENERMAVELFFWAPNGNGDEFLKAAEAWSKDRGAEFVMMGAHEPCDPRAPLWYKRKGYSPFGRNYMKVL